VKTLPAWLPEWAKAVGQVLLHPHALLFLGTASVVMFLLSAVGVPWFVARLPADYFTRHERQELGLAAARRSGWRIALAVAKNLLGLVLLLAGIAMLVLPGQGLLTLVVGLILVEFPGKRKLERRIIAFGPVLKAVNALRHRAHRPPLGFD
jgi:hypothetical protein